MRILVFVLGVMVILLGLETSHAVDPSWSWVWWTWLGIWLGLGLVVAIVGLVERALRNERKGASAPPGPRPAAPTIQQ